MASFVLTEAEYRAFGITKEEGDALSQWILERVGYVLGANGRGGSGIFVETSNGETALLTARHVLVPAIISGELTVAHYASGVARSVEPNALVMARRADAALVYLKNMRDLPRLAKSDWDPQAFPTVSKGIGVVAAGAPGEWKATPDIARRVIEFARTLLFWTAVVEPSLDDSILCDIDEIITTLPSTLRGMSGGPVIDLQRRLVGINLGETRGVKDGFLYVTPRSSWTDIFAPFQPTDDMPDDYIRQEALMDRIAKHRNSDAPPIRAFFSCEFFWSPTRPEHKYGEIGRILGAAFQDASGGVRYPVNMESIFFLPPDHDDAARRNAFEEEVFYILNSMEYDVLT